MQVTGKVGMRGWRYCLVPTYLPYDAQHGELFLLLSLPEIWLNVVIFRVRTPVLNSYSQGILQLFSRGFKVVVKLIGSLHGLYLLQVATVVFIYTSCTKAPRAWASKAPRQPSFCCMPRWRHRFESFLPWASLALLEWKACDCRLRHDINNQGQATHFS